MSKPLKIAFLGYNAPLTARYLEQLAEDNAEQVAWYNRRMEITRNQAATIGRILDCCTGSIIPSDFRVQVYDIDEEAPK
jgi:hypothetical protein